MSQQKWYWNVILDLIRDRIRFEKSLVIQVLITRGKKHV